MITPKFPAEIRGCQIRPMDITAYIAHLKELEGKKVSVVIKKYSPTRTSPENRYYWGVVVEMLADEFGITTKDDMHEILKNLFLKVRIILTTGKTIQSVEYVRSTSGLSIAEFEDYLSKIRMWASIEHQFYIPLPNEVEIPNYY